MNYQFSRAVIFSVVSIFFSTYSHAQCTTGCDVIINSAESYFGNTTLVPVGQVSCIVSGGSINSGGNLIINGTLRVCSGASAIQAGNLSFGASGLLQIYEGASVNITGNASPADQIEVPSCPLPPGITLPGGCAGATVNVALPIELRVFVGSITTRKTSLLEWVTSSEKNNEYFSIQYSSDGESFEEIARLDGQGDSDEEVKYVFEDTHPRFGTFYYRLKQVDYDGKYSYSPVIALTQNPTDDILIYPNPTANDISIRLFGKHKDAIVSLLNSNGEEIAQQNQQLKGNKMLFSTEHLSKGIYFLQVLSNDDVRYFRVVRE